MVILMALTMPIAAQNTLIFDGTVDMCDGVFVDDGDGAAYSETDYTFTICPDSPDDVVSAMFVAFNLETNPNPNNSDQLYIYDGPDAGSPTLGSYTGTTLQGLPVTATVNNPSGCLTFVFQSIGANTGCGGGVGCPGWEAIVTCTTPCDPPTAASAIVDPLPLDPGLQSVGVCMGQTLEFSDMGSASAPGFTLDNWIWNFDDGNVDSLGVAGSVFYAFDEPGEYVVQLAVVDNNGCVSLNVQPLQVLVSTIPEFNSISSTPICAGSPGFVDGNPVQSITWTALPPQVVAGETYLADGAGFSYSSDLNFDFFDDGATLDDCDDLLSITVNLEHSYLGDLALSIQCPNGTLVDIMTFPNGGGGCYLGEAVDDGSNLPGTGYDYGWSPNPDFATNINDNANWTMTAYTDNAGNAENNNIVNPGIYTSENNLCDLVGCPLNGTWTFSVLDNLAIDNGYIFEWGLNFDPTLIPGVTTFTPVIGLGMDSSYWTGPGIVDQDLDLNYADILLDNPGFYDYTFTVTNNFSCTFDTTLTVEVVEGPENSITAGPDVIFCGDAVQLQGAFIGGGPSACSGSEGTEVVCYDNSANDIYTYCPDVPGDGTMMSITLSAGQVENFFDAITFYDGDNVFAPQITQIQGLFNETSVVATNPDGCLTVLITSDASVSCGSGAFDPITWCIGCGGGDACGFLWSWEPADDLDGANTASPTVNTFDGSPTEYVAFVEPIGLDNCATTDTVLVLPGFEFTSDFADPTCLITDGWIELVINEPASDGPWQVDLSNVLGSIESLNFAGGTHTFADLESGDYTLTVSDALGCEYVIEFDLADPSPPSLTVSDDDVVCINGTATISVEAESGGPWIYTWTSGGQAVAVGSTILVSPTGTTTYDVEGVDAAGCITLPGSVTIGVYDPLVVNIAADDLICLGDSVELTAIASSGGSGSGYNWVWTWESAAVSTGEVAYNQPPVTGEFCVTFSDNCTSPEVTACMEVEVEVPFDVQLSVDTTRGCAPQAFVFAHNMPTTSLTALTWDFGDGGNSISQAPIHTYDNPGIYDVALTVTSTTGCVYTAFENDYIALFDVPNVGYNATPQPTTAPDTYIEFESSVSSNVVEWWWTFDSTLALGYSDLPDPSFRFPFDRGGLYPVTLAVVDTNGCSNQITRYIEIYDFFNVYIPNAFTPNNDGFNDIFKVYGTDIDPDRFLMQVFNRWGELIFETTELNNGWIGQAEQEAPAEEQYYAQDAMYTYRVVIYSKTQHEKKEFRGGLTLTR
ncbi:MAG: PKD domain-containing protein [Flavobacteriales bacterium]|nr:PKD domain-containing protein [Flavobacteriales bacterium]